MFTSPRSQSISLMPRKQKGVILILALLIVALVTTVVVSVSWRFSLSMARNENRWHGSQARLYLETAEEIATYGLYLDKTAPKTANTDTALEGWNQEVQFPIQEVDGWIGGRLEDANRRLNLNLINRFLQPGTDGKPSKWVQSPTYERFVRLLQLIELESGPIDELMAIEIADSVVDWIDADDSPTMNGAERSYYENLDPPYPIANSPITSVSDLLIIKGMTSELYDKLVPYVFAYPVKAIPGGDSGQPTQIPEESKLNVNTMPPVLLRTFNSPGILRPLREDALQSFQMPLTDEGFTSVDEFKEQLKFIVDPPLNPNEEVDLTDLTTKSYYFILYAETQVGEQYRRGSSLLYRNDQGAVQVLRRTESLF